VNASAHANSPAFIDLPDLRSLDFKPMIGETISYYRIIEKLGGWASSIRPRENGLGGVG